MRQIINRNNNSWNITHKNHVYKNSTYSINDEVTFDIFGGLGTHQSLKEDNKNLFDVWLQFLSVRYATEYITEADLM